MTTMIHTPTRDCVSSLGIPVDNLTLEQATEQIITMGKRRDGRARLVSTLNVDFLVNSLGTRFRSPRHPELLDVLRNADLVTADGFPILWLSKIIGDRASRILTFVVVAVRRRPEVIGGFHLVFKVGFLAIKIIEAAHNLSG